VRNRRHNPDGTMSLRDHLYDLRYRLGLALLFVVVGGVFGFMWFQWRLGPIPSLGDLLFGPYCALPPGVRFEPTPGKCELLQTQPFEAFMISFKVGIAAGAVLTCPLWIYQIWAFIAPGLYAKERKFALTFVGFGAVLFIAGALLAYFVVPEGLKVLVSFGGDNFITALNAGDYVSFVLVLLMIFGVSFEMPLLVVMLNRIGILPYDKLRRWRRGIIFGLFIFAAVATPGTDPISMLALAVAMTVLFELSVQVSRIHDRRKARRESTDEFAFEGLGDDEASPLDLRPHPEEQPSPTPQAGSNPPGGSRSNYDDVT
jgi:sec-independent protein translocase protein TatC